MITAARIREYLEPEPGVGWITASRAPQIQRLAADGPLQLSLFDQRDLAEITHPAFPGKRLMACRNPLLAEERKRKREELLAATEQHLDRIATATRRPRKPLRGKQEIGLTVGKLLGRYKMGKHFALTITDLDFHWERKPASIKKEAALDGMYVIRTNVPAESLSAEQAVARYKSLSSVESAFRSMKSVDLVDLNERPIFHRQEGRVKAHIFLCMLAYYVEWHMRRALAPLLFDDEEGEAAAQQRTSVVARARRSPGALAKESAKQYVEGLPIHSFRTLLADLATLTRNRIRLQDQTFHQLASPTPIQSTCSQATSGDKLAKPLEVCHLAASEPGNFGLVRGRPKLTNFKVKARRGHSSRDPGMGSEQITTKRLPSLVSLHSLQGVPTSLTVGDRVAESALRLLRLGRHGAASLQIRFAEGLGSIQAYGLESPCTKGNKPIGAFKKLSPSSASAK